LSGLFPTRPPVRAVPVTGAGRDPSSGGARVIEARNLTKVYGNLAAVDGVSFDAARGEILGFLGPNGAGKTTAMRILTCYLPPTSGEARVAGFDILTQSREVRARIGYLPENVPLYRDLTVSDYLDFVARLKGMPRSNRAARTRQVMEECGVDHVGGRMIGKLSKGYRQRVGLAQALINDPEVLILDEPTVGLDPQQIIEIRQLIRSLSGRRTVILSTHILPEASLLCHRVIIINKGKIVTADTPENLKTLLRRSMVVDVVLRGDGDAAQRLISSLPDIKNVASVGSRGEVHTLRVESRDDRDARENLSRVLVENGFGLLGLAAIDMSLEEIFVEIVTREELE
jgi:ABC-2 type transport system ATP-binding protein